MSILLATDGSASSLKAAQWLNHFVSPDHTQITLVSVVTVPSIEQFGTAGLYPNASEMYQEALQDTLKEAKARAQAALDQTAQVLTECPPVAQVALSGNPAEAIVHYAHDHQMDLIVMGRRGHSALGNLFGSVSFGVLQRSKIPVTVVSAEH
jgi:nucleotide-binding universal stress UspA family protein